MANDIEKRVYRRGQRWWLDARIFRDVDGGREPLCEPGRTVATSDRSRALALAKLRIAELESLRLTRQTEGLERGLRLQDAAREWLIFLARDTDLENATIESYEWATRWIIILMKENPFLHELTTFQARNLRTAASKAVSKRTRKPLSSRSQRHIVKTLQLIIEWGQTEGVVPSGLDVVAPALKRMRVRNKQTPYFEPVEVAAFLQGVVDTAGSITPTVLLTFVWAMTGARRTGARGLLMTDLDRHHGVVSFVCNAWRKIKGRDLGHRSVPLWPLLALAVRAYRPQHNLRSGNLLCPAISRQGRECMISDVRPLWRQAQARAISILDEAGIKNSLNKHRVTPRALRVAYASARVQTLDRGEPVADRTVAYELGHQSKQMLDRVYVRIGKSVHRTRRPVVEFRLPSGRLPGEVLFRDLLGSAEVDLISALETPVTGDVLKALGLEV